MAKKKARPANLQRHFERVSELGCLITGSPYPTLHHPHGGSMKDIGVWRGKSQKISDWLVLPIRWDYHTGPMGIDSGQPWLTVREWEKRFGKQVDMVDKVCRLLGYNCWQLAGIDREVAGMN